MIEPKEIEIDGKTFILSKFPAVAGREIIAKYPLTSLPKVGDYELNQATMFKLMSYVGVKAGGDQPLMLKTQSLIDNHVKSWETLAKLEIAMMEYNCSFFQNGKISGFLDNFGEMISDWITKILTQCWESSSPKEKQPSKN